MVGVDDVRLIALVAVGFVIMPTGISLSQMVSCRASQSSTGVAVDALILDDASLSWLFAD